MNYENPFDRLVSELGKDERLTLLEKLSTASLPSETENIEAPDKAETSDLNYDIQTKLKNESVLLRFWLFLKSIFTGMNQRVIYNDLLISRKSKILAKNFPDIYDMKKNSLLTGFFVELKNLHQAADFYKPGIASYEESPGEAYVFLGSLFLSDLYEKIEKETSPYSVDFSRSPNQELRNSLIRKMDDLLSGISVTERQNLYQNVQSLEWLKQLVKLPFEKFLSRFTSFNHSDFLCPLDNVSTELNHFVKVLCYSKKITPEVLETLYMLTGGFSNKKNEPKNTDIDNIRDPAKEFHEQCLDSILKINGFIKNVPVKTLAAVASKDADWVMPNPAGIEDWFVKFKAQWRKQFDRKWESWLVDRKKSEIRLVCEKVFGEVKLPLIGNRPWSNAWGGIPCNRDYSLGFLYSFFMKLYPKIAAVLKIIQLEGDFVLRETRVEFTNAYNDFAKQNEDVISLNAKLAEGGTLYESFENIAVEKLRTIQNQSRMDSLMLSIETEISMLSSKFGATCREFINILEGILKIKKDTKQEVITNLSMLQGLENQQFRINLLDSYDKLSISLELLKQLEGIESSENVAKPE